MLSQLLLVSTKVDYLDSLIGAAIILFILSLITEKFVSFLRKYFCFPKKLNKFNLFMNVNADIDNEIDINQKRLSEKKQNEISALSILIGIIIAFMARASLFDLITSNPQDKLFWKEGWDLTCDWTTIQFIIGTLFTGFFLSFGSKFFHDLLDTLYQSKELKRKLQNPQTYTQNSASQVSDFVNLNSFEIAKLALVKHEKAIKKKYKDVLENIEIGNTATNQIGIIVNLTRKPNSFFSNSVRVKMPNGKIANVEVESIVDEIADAQYGLNCRVLNLENVDYTGAFGGVLVNEQNSEAKFILTCSHVALGGSSKDLGGFGDFDIEAQITEYDVEKSLGKVVYAKMDENNDTSIIQIEDDFLENWNNELPNGNILGPAISVLDLTLEDKIFFYSSLEEELIEGSIHKRTSLKEVKIKYNDLKVRTFLKLIVLGNNKGGYWRAISQKGDSGSIVFDSFHRPFGMIIGGGSQFTYAIPLSDILNQTQMKIFLS